MAAWTLISRPIGVATCTRIGPASEYCVVWGGDHSGDLAILSRQDPKPSDPNGGVTYPCYTVRESGERIKLADEGFVEFDELAARWSSERGGSCR